MIWIFIDDDLKFSCAEILFKPALLTIDKKDQDLSKTSNTTGKKAYVGIDELVTQSIKKCDEYLQTSLYENIIISGGTTLLTGFSERLHHQLSTISYNKHRQIYIEQDSQRRYGAWIGGSMYASLPTFNHIKYSYNDYRVDTDIVHKKFF